MRTGQRVALSSFFNSQEKQKREKQKNYLLVTKKEAIKGAPTATPKGIKREGSL